MWKPSTALRLGVILAGFVSLLQPAYAQTAKQHSNTWRVLTGLPRIVGRTGRNMATFKDPVAALTQWGQCAAVIVDLAETAREEKADPGAVETSPLLPKHPGPVSLSITGVYACLLEGSYTQILHERGDGMRTYGAKFTGLVLSGVLHGQAAAINAQNASQAAARARLAPGQAK